MHIKISNLKYQFTEHLKYKFIENIKKNVVFKVCIDWIIEFGNSFKNKI